MNRKYTAEHVDWIKANISGCAFKDLTADFNKHFGLDIKVSAMVSLCDRNGLHNGRDTRLFTGWPPTQFKKGHVPANKGTHNGGWPPTQFKKGNIPANHRPVGSERVNVDGYIEIKVADPNKWRLKHRVIWEGINGPIPKGHAILFGDGNKQNINTANLILVSKRQLVILNHMRLIQNDADLTRTAVIIADLFHKIHNKRRSIRENLPHHTKKRGRYSHEKM